VRAVRISVLASGSGGNCVYVESGGSALLVDCGLTVPGLRRRLAEAGGALERVVGVLLTHDHGDHVGSSVALARKLSVPIHATEGTLSILARLPEGLAHPLRAGGRVQLGPFEVLPFATPHDGIESVGYRVEAGGCAAGVATDLGYVSNAVVEALRGVQFLLAEFNHDPQLLREGPYPEGLKRRIAGGRGHLSNEQGAELVALLMHPGLSHLVLAHLSETNNTPGHALRAWERRNGASPPGLRVHVAQQRQPSPMWDLAAGASDDRTVCAA